MEPNLASPAEAEARTWLEAACPNVWKLLNQRARRTLPPGLIEYLTTGDVECSRQHLAFADADIALLLRVCGAKTVGDAYRPDLSGVATETQLAQHLCELSVAAALSNRASGIELRPLSGCGKTRSDFAVTLAGVQVYGEVKRYEDTFLLDSDGTWRARSLVKTPPGALIPSDAERPRSMALVSKLEHVPRQFPDGTVNVLFVYHLGITDNHRHVQIALFGDAAALSRPEDVCEPSADGLFAREAWCAVSACYLAHVSPERRLYFAPRWLNPRARVHLPDGVRQMLDSFDFDSVRARRA